MSDQPFGRRTVVLLSVLGGLSLLVALFVGQMGGGDDVSGVRHPDSLDSGALGHRAFLELLRRSDFSVKQTSWRTEQQLGQDTVLVLLEPDLRVIDAQRRLVEMMSASRRTLLVLPKWRAYQSDDREDWVDRVAFMPPERVREILGPLEALADGEGFGAWDAEDVLNAYFRRGTVSRLERPSSTGPWSTGPVTSAPTLTHPQLVTGSGLVELVECPEGALVFELRRGENRVLVLTDPDVIATHGLGDGDNAALALELVELLARPGDTLVVDETLHGRELRPGIWSAMRRWPLVLLPIQGLIVAAILLWAAAGRFGPPLPVAPALDAGKSTLIENTVGLLVSGGHAADLVRRYSVATHGRVADAYHVQALPETVAQRERLEELSEARGVPLPGVTAGRTSSRRQDRDSARELIASARRIHRWREEMLHGAGRRTRTG